MWFLAVVVSNIKDGRLQIYRKQLTELGGNKVVRSRPRAVMFLVSFANFKSRVLFRGPSGDRLMPRAEVCGALKREASHGNITEHFEAP